MCRTDQDALSAAAHHYCLPIVHHCIRIGHLCIRIVPSAWGVFNVFVLQVTQEGRLTRAWRGATPAWGLPAAVPVAAWKAISACRTARELPSFRQCREIVIRCHPYGACMRGARGVSRFPCQYGTCQHGKALHSMAHCP